MIRQSLEVVPTVLPKYRLEEDARLAEERRRRQRQSGQKSEAAAVEQVERYRIVGHSDSAKGTAGVRLFSLLTSPELGSRVPQRLHVLEAPKKTWKRVRRTVYRGVLRSASALDGDAGEEDNNDDNIGCDDDCDGDGGNEGGAPRFSSLPLPEHENMACLLLTLPVARRGAAEPVAGEATVAQARWLSAPLHALRYERVGAPKEGQGISTSWYSGMDVRSVGFKRSYIDDDGADDDDQMSSLSDDATPVGRQGRKKRGEETEANASKKKKTETNISSSNNKTPAGEVDGVTTNAQQGDASQTAAVEPPVSVLPSSALRAAEEAKKPVATLDFSGVDAGNLESLTASLLQQWAAAGKAAVPFNEVAKTVLKAHPQYAGMKAKHQSPQGRQEAVEWFRVSQTEVRAHILHLGYTIDSTNNVYLLQQQKT
ncbi:hypothetical protein DQ04_00941140 [Trypanosoma grayi]|uniref:hypothetical protein n=1 Tax=Trypanosoma grayi TaxID=71804 RepID=UPI0004F463A7|nr:hypothetical protein DQ04_00941140 [Trypanosoma grayi]KEG13550.1 hypothetical protein DQ04_00941140 [Trypanosoma grayi]